MLDRSRQRPLSVVISGQVIRRFIPLSPHSTSRLARQADTGLAQHRVLDIDELVVSAGADQAAVVPPPAVVRPVYDWEAANQRKHDAVKQLAPLVDALDDLDIRVAELLAKTKAVELG